MARELSRVNLNLTKDLVDRIDEYADLVGINRTAAVSVLCSQALSAYTLTNTLDYAMKQDKLLAQEKKSDC